MVYTSLTDAPRNFREGIDWLVALKRKGFENNLKAISDAVYNFLADKPVGSDQLPAFQNVKLITKEFMEQEGLKDHLPVKLMLTRFNRPKDEKSNVFAMLLNAAGDSDDTEIPDECRFNAENIAQNLAKTVNGCEKFLENVKIPNQYESAYSSEATWEKSCSKKPEDCAAVFVGIAPMLYTGLMSLWDATDADNFRLFPSKAKKNLEDLLNALRYVKPECRDKLDRSEIVNALSGVGIEELDTLMELSEYWIFHGSNNDGAVEGLEAAKSVDEVEGEETVKDMKAVSEKPRVQYVKPVKPRKFYMGSREVYGIPGVDIDMGLVNAWNFTKGKKPVKTLTGLGSDNIYYPGMPTVANLNAASFI